MYATNYQEEFGTTEASRKCIISPVRCLLSVVASFSSYQGRAFVCEYVKISLSLVVLVWLMINHSRQACPGNRTGQYLITYMVGNIGYDTRGLISFKAAHPAYEYEMHPHPVP